MGHNAACQAAPARASGEARAEACATWGRRTRWFGRRHGQLDRSERERALAGEPFCLPSIGEPVM